MRLIIQDGRIVATATDEYAGPDPWLDEPEDFDVLLLGHYRVVDGVLVIPPPHTPSEITIRQARLALHAAGLLDDVEAAIATAGRAAQIEWEYASVFRRDNPVLTAMQSALGLTDEMLDQLFVGGAAL